jgi:hypothetical protein
MPVMVRGDPGVDDGFFDRLCRRCKNRIETVVRQHFWSLVFPVFGVLGSG